MLTSEERRERMRKICSDETPCIIITLGLEPPAELIENSNELNIPVLRSSIATTILSSRITDFLENQLAPTATIHGVLVDVYGVGMLRSEERRVGKGSRSRRSPSP